MGWIEQPVAQLTEWDVGEVGSYYFMVGNRSPNTDVDFLSDGDFIPYQLPERTITEPDDLALFVYFWLAKRTSEIGSQMCAPLRYVASFVSRLSGSCFGEDGWKLFW